MATLIEKYAFQSWSWVRNLVLYEYKTTKDEIFFALLSNYQKSGILGRWETSERSECRLFDLEISYPYVSIRWGRVIMDDKLTFFKTGLMLKEPIQCLKWWPLRQQNSYNGVQVFVSVEYFRLSSNASYLSLEKKSSAPYLDPVSVF